MNSLQELRCGLMVARSFHTIYRHETRFLSIAKEPESSVVGKSDRVRTSEAELRDGAPDQSPKQFRLRESKGSES